MTTAARASIPVSRPKIHKLPAALPRQEKKPKKRLLIAHPLFIWSLVFAAFFLLSPAMHKSPLSAVTETPSSETATSAAALPATVEPMSVLNAQKSKKIIVLQGISGTIIGQMAKIPAESEQITEIKPVSAVDNQAGHELLSIISKY